jgi:hypothetical protein
MTSTTRWPEFIGYHDVEGMKPSPALDSDLLAASNAKLAKLGLAEIMEHVVVDGRNAILYKGPQAAEYLAVLEDSNRRAAEFRQSDFYMKMKTDQETWEAKVRAGLFTVQELAPEYFTAEELDPINAPKMCDLFTAEELEPLKNFTLMDCTVPLRNLLKEGARRMRSEKN